MVKIKFRVMGKKWSLKVPPSKRYKKKHGTDSVAMTMCYKRQIDLHPKGTDLETIVHELVHAYAGEMCLKSTNKIKKYDWEEIYAEMLAKRGREILSLAGRLHKAIQRLTEK